jgi:transcriptional regulator with XRE-family HTH domain
MAYIRSVKQFIAMLKQARIDKDLTQAQLGEMIGVSQKKIAMIENLTASPRLDILLTLASALDLTLELKREGNLSRDSSKKMKFVWE